MCVDPSVLCFEEYEGGFPFEGEFRLVAEEELCPMTKDDLRFDSEFKKICNKYIDLNDIDEEIEETLEEIINEKLCTKGPRIGGYPFFTQKDVRIDDENLREHTVLLLQIDSDDNIMWGDDGVANFFIKPEDLAACDFSNVIYTWDCYKKDRNLYQQKNNCISRDFMISPNLIPLRNLYCEVVLRSFDLNNR